MTATAPDAVLRELGELLMRIDPVPPELAEQVRRSFCWRTLDAELAELSFDSLVDREPALAVRSDGDRTAEPRLLGFGAVVDGQDLSIDVEINSAAGGSTLVGQLWPAGATSIQVQTGTGEVGTVPTDELGRFFVEPVPQGPVRLRVEHGGRVVQTTWVSYVRG